MSHTKFIDALAAGILPHVSEFERPQPVNLGRYQCARCRRLVSEHGKFEHNKAKHPELYAHVDESERIEQVYRDIADQTGWKP